MGKLEEIVYNLYLDESGDFNNDLKKENKPECIVGGYLIKESDNASEEKLEEYFCNKLRNIKNLEGISKNRIINAVRHSTELRENEKKEIVFNMLSAIHEMKCEFVIFENYQKNKIVDDTITYINILAEGCIQLLLDLMIKNQDKRIKLNIVAGGRRDMTKGEENIEYIAEKDVEKRLNERMHLLKIKYSLPLKNAEYSLMYGNDKKDLHLIACDYICNFYFTKSKKLYKSKLPNSEDTYRDVLLAMYDEKNIYSLKSIGELEWINRSLNDGNYSGLLFDLALGLIEEKNEKYIFEAVAKIKPECLSLQLRNLSNYIYDIVGNERNIKLGNQVVSFGYKLLDYLNNNGKMDVRFQMELILYKLTLLNHNGNLEEMKKYFNDGLKCLPKMLKYSENIDLAWMFYNRYAVYLFDEFEPEKANKLIDKVKEQFSAYEIILEEFEKINKEIFSTSEKLQNIKSIQKGKLLGTQAMIAGYLQQNGKISYETAVKICNDSIDNFETDYDKKRQYQNMLTIEINNNNYAKSIEYLLKGCGVDTVEKLIKDKHSVFEMYNISKFLSAFSKVESQETKMLMKYMRDNENEYIGKIDYPQFITAGNMAIALSERESELSKIDKYYKSSYEYSKDENPLFIYLKLMLLCGHISYRWDFDKEHRKKLIEEAEEMINVSKNLNISAKMREMLDNFCNEKNCKEKYEKFAKQRQY